MTAQPAPLDRRQRRKAETRQRLLDAATRLFAKQGFEATRPQDIAREADVAVGTFYLHFADRSDAFLAFTEHAADALTEHARARVHDDESRFEVRLRSYLEAILDYMDQNPGVVGAALANEAVIGADPARRGQSLRDRLARSLARGIEQGMERGELHADYDPQLVGYALVGLIQQALTHGTQLHLGREAVLDQIERFCARALSLDALDGGPDGGKAR